MSSSTSSSSSGSDGDGAYIEHLVTKFDTLAGVAIKYGVEVADIKKMNGLVNDLQMFGLKSLRIPLPGRHLTYRSFDGSGSFCSDTIPDHSIKQVGLKTAKVKSTLHISPAMSSLQRYYSLKPPNSKEHSDDLELKVIDMGVAHPQHDEINATGSLPSKTILNGHHKTRSLGNGFFSGKGTKDFSNAEFTDWGSGGFEEQFFHNVQKTETDKLPGTPTPEKMLRTQSGSGSSSFSPTTGKGLAMRVKPSSRINFAADTESGSGTLTSVTSGISDLLTGTGITNIPKSSNLHRIQANESGGNFLSIWSNGKWSLKPELPSLPTPSIPKPLDGFRGKAARD